MTRGTGKRPFHYANRLPADPALQRFAEWPADNRGFYDRFRHWLRESGFSESSVHQYGGGARLALSFLQKPYWQIDLDTDIERVRAFIAQYAIAPATRAMYYRGLNKLVRYMRLRYHRPEKPKEIPWQAHIGSLSPRLQEDVRNFIQFCQHGWKAEVKFERSCDNLCNLARPLRWLAEHAAVQEAADLTPQAWYAFLDVRVASGISAKTINHELSSLKHFIYFLEENERPVCMRFLQVDYLEDGRNLPKDVPVAQLRQIQDAILAEMKADRVPMRRMGCMDLAWFLLMLHSGLRTGEIRNLKLAEIEWQARRVRITQSKGLKDRLVCLSAATLEALKEYLKVRGPADVLPENVFIFRHAALSKTYCYERLVTYGERCGFRVKPHQIRHSCATLLLNAGAPVLTVQAILGHKEVDTTLGYARLYDGTVAADYYQAMNKVERQLALPEDRLALPPSPGQLLALVDALRNGMLNPAQTEIVWALREGLSLLAEQETAILAEINVPTG